MTGKIFNLWFADTGLFNKSCADRMMAACGVFLVWLFSFLPWVGRIFLKTALNVLAFSKCRIILSSLVCENMQRVIPPPLLACRAGWKGSWILTSADITWLSLLVLFCLCLGHLPAFIMSWKAALQELGFLCCRYKEQTAAAFLSCWWGSRSSAWAGWGCSSSQVLFRSGAGSVHCKG